MKDFITTVTLVATFLSAALFVIAVVLIFMVVQYIFSDQSARDLGDWVRTYREAKQ